MRLGINKPIIAGSATNKKKKSIDVKEKNPGCIGPVEVQTPTWLKCCSWTSGELRRMKHLQTSISIFTIFGSNVITFPFLMHKNPFYNAHLPSATHTHAHTHAYPITVCALVFCLPSLLHMSGHGNVMGRVTSAIKRRSPWATVKGRHRGDSWLISELGSHSWVTALNPPCGIKIIFRPPPPLSVCLVLLDAVLTELCSTGSQEGH